MNEFFALLGDTLIAISGLLIVIACGAVMHRLHILTDTILNALSKVLVYLMVPILLFSCMIQFDNLSEILKTNWIFTVSVALIVAFGFSVSKFSGQLFGVRQRTRSSVMCATALPNGGYIPLALNVMLCSVFPQFLNMENKGISMVAMGMMVFIPSIWIVGYGLLTATSFELRNWRKILTRPSGA